jgi:hypothetical protein
MIYRQLECAGDLINAFQTGRTLSAGIVKNLEVFLYYCGSGTLIDEF